MIIKFKLQTCIQVTITDNIDWVTDKEIILIVLEAGSMRSGFSMVGVHSAATLYSDMDGKRDSNLFGFFL
jgi:hypothetical protein